MVFNPILSYPTLDKIHLKSMDYHLAGSSQFITDMKCNATGDILSENKYCNLPGINLTVRKDKQGNDAAYIYFNPNKVDEGFLISQCNRAGLDFNMANSNVIRLDLERHQQLNFNVKSYHSVLSAAGSGRKDIISHNGTYTTGSRAIQWQLYDKSLQVKLDIPNICRGETRYLKPHYLIKAGLSQYQDLAAADLMKLYNKPFELYLNNLSKIGQDRELIGQDIQQLEHLFKVNSRAMQTFINIKGIEQKGLDYFLHVIQVADIPKQKRYNAKKFLLGLSDKLNMGFKSEMVRELLSYFNAA